MSIPMDEQETSIQYDRTGKYMYVYTSDSTQMTILDKKVENHPDTWMLTEEIKDKSGNIVGKKYKADKKMLTFRNEKGHRTGNSNAGEGLKKWREEQKKKKEEKI